ncbi:MAG TPA: cyanoexosortase B system-associated protein [Phormidium sp.]
MLLKFAKKNTNLTKFILLLFLSILLFVGAVPGYLQKHWTWEKPLPVKTISQMRQIRQKGLELPGWQIKTSKEVSVSGEKWLYQEVQIDPQTTAILLLRPQKDDKDQPQVQWVDVKGFQRWQSDRDRRVQFTVPPKGENQQPAKVEAQFFRGWNRQQTFAVLQWYAWYPGGSPDPASWFWLDQIAQWQGRRVPWVAVSIQIPIEPLGDIEPVLPQAQSLGQSVQAALMSSSLQRKKN